MEPGPEMASACTGHTGASPCYSGEAVAVRCQTLVSFTDLLLLFFRGLCVPFPARIVLVVVFWTVLWNSVGLFWGSAFLPCGFEATALFFEFVPCKIAKANLAFEWKN